MRGNRKLIAVSAALVTAVAGVVAAVATVGTERAVATVGTERAVATAGTGRAHAGAAALPRPDHVVVVVLENHAYGEVIENRNAPYLSSLASQGANLTRSYAVTHPSEPNYLALFSGSTQGLTDDSCPHTYTAANLGRELTAAGFTFAGYSEGMPSDGYTGCASGRYARKHNPWVDFTDVPASANLRYSRFPTDYRTLPTVSFVIPDLCHDMHDCGVAAGDTWVRQNLDGYVQWARTHNSLFVLTFDEDDYGAGNRIPTVLVGQHVKPGASDTRTSHYGILRTLLDLYGLPCVAQACAASPLTDIWN